MELVKGGRFFALDVRSLCGPCWYPRYWFRLNFSGDGSDDLVQLEINKVGVTVVKLER